VHLGVTLIEMLMLRAVSSYWMLRQALRMALDEGRGGAERVNHGSATLWPGNTFFLSLLGFVCGVKVLLSRVQCRTDSLGPTAYRLQTKLRSTAAPTFLHLPLTPSRPDADAQTTFQATTASH
jgi:hypothetical protein